MDVALPNFNRMRHISQTWVCEARISLESDYYCGHSDADQHLRYGHVFLRLLHYAFMLCIYRTVIPFSPHQYVVTMRNVLTVNVMIIHH